MTKKYPILRSTWNLFIKINVSGDYNKCYKRPVSEIVDDFGNGQPSLIYMIPDINNKTRSDQIQLVGQNWSNIYSSPGIYDTVQISSTHLLIKNFNLTRIK